PAFISCIMFIILRKNEYISINFNDDPLISFVILSFIGHYACCNGDTWSSELGILSNKDPYLITTMKRVPKGTNGGISLLGTLSSIAAGLTIGISFYLCLLIKHSYI